MDKVITITSHTGVFEGKEKFVETEYPTLNKYLEDGYNVFDKLLTTNSNVYTITFILRKIGGIKQTN